MTSATSKPVTSLTRDDFTEFPIWEYVTDEEGSGSRDETWVRPVKHKIIPRKAYSQLVGADIRTLSGRDIPGFMLVTTASKPVQVRPGALLLETYMVLPTVSREIAVQQNYGWSIERREAILKALKARESQVFPLTYRLRVPIAGEAVLLTGLVE